MKFIALVVMAAGNGKGVLVERENSRCPSYKDRAITEGMFFT
jgi:hypothetical protein